MQFRSMVGPNGEMVNTDGSLNSLACWIVDKQLKVDKPLKKDIPLASTKIIGGMLLTKDFGDFKITPVNSIYSNSFSMEIYNDKVQALRDFLQNVKAE